MAATSRRWLTPDDDQTGHIKRPVFIPEGEVWEAAFRGALLLLADPENWEAFGSITPEATAAEFWECFLETEANWGVCS